ncbi:MAG: ATP-binding cassette domain-containing protein [Firmicutes bacterium]|nr:ATP-binding cassette domain-containing protein [Bacillota bacterium]
MNERDKIPHDRKDIVRVGCLEHIYPDQTEVKICGLEFIVREGEKVAVLGPNGSGKTTLLNHIMGLLRPVSGEISVFGVDPSKEFDQIRRNFGVVFQNVDAQLIAPTVWDDVTFSPRNYGYSPAEVERLGNEILTRIGILDLKSKITHYLSGGEKKKVALAGAMITHAKLLVLDEPFEGLDPRSRDDIVGLLNEFNRDYGTAIVFTTHDVNLVPRIADRVYVMAQGNITLSGKPKDIFEQVDYLKSINLEPPLIAEMVMELKRQGIEIAFTNDIGGLVSNILELIGRAA